MIQLPLHTGLSPNGELFNASFNEESESISIDSSGGYFVSNTLEIPLGSCQIYINWFDADYVSGGIIFIPDLLLIEKDSGGLTMFLNEGGEWSARAFENIPWDEFNELEIDLSYSQQNIAVVLGGDEIWSGQWSLPSSLTTSIKFLSSNIGATLTSAYISAEASGNISAVSWSFVEEKTGLKMAKIIDRHYYKFWSFPKLTANGTVGENAYACRAGSYYNNNADYQAYRALDRSNSTFWASASSSSDWFEIYSPVEFLVSEIKFRNRSSYQNTFSHVDVYMSSDGNIYEKVFSYDNTVFTASGTWSIPVPDGFLKTCKYLKLSGTGQSGNSNTISIAELTINGREPATSESFDYYRDFQIYKGVVL